MSAGKIRGSCRVPDVSDRSMPVEVSSDSGHGMDCHGHGSRDGVWMVVSGPGRVGSEGVTGEGKVEEGMELPVGCKHDVSASSDGLRIIEVQIGWDKTVVMHKLLTEIE